jgi:small subunit ribosomal protein S8
MNDTLGDLINRLKTVAALPNGKAIEVPLCKLNESVAKLLEKLGYVQNVRVFKASATSHKSLHLETTNKVTDLRRISKPGRRVYLGYSELRPVLGGVGVAILSTPRGIMTDRAARKFKVGGEVLFEIW